MDNPHAGPPQAEPSQSPQFLGYAGGHATSSVPVAHGDELAGELRSRLVGQEFQTVEDVAVLDGDKLVGLLPVERLLEAGPNERVAEIMDADPPRDPPMRTRARPRGRWWSGTNAAWQSSMTTDAFSA
jgi:hypothetical protein